MLHYKNITNVDLRDLINMSNDLELIVKEDKNYKLTRLGSRTFAEEIIIKTEEKVLRDYVYVDSYRVIA